MNTQPTTETAAARDEPLLDIKEVAHLLKVSERHVRNLIEQKLITVVRLGGALRFEPEEVRLAKRRMSVLAR